MSFSSDIAKFNKNFDKVSTNIFRGTTLSLFGSIVLRTPVDTGRLRGNWYASLNRPSKKVDGSAEGYEPTVFSAKLGDSIYLVNNLSYAKVIEDGDHSDQAPHGMVKVTVAEFQRVVKQNVRKYKR